MILRCPGPSLPGANRSAERFRSHCRGRGAQPVGRLLSSRLPLAWNAWGWWVVAVIRWQVWGNFAAEHACCGDAHVGNGRQHVLITLPGDDDLSGLDAESDGLGVRAYLDGESGVSVDADIGESRDGDVAVSGRAATTAHAWCRYGSDPWRPRYVPGTVIVPRSPGARRACLAGNCSRTYA